jgi:dGTPase
LRAFLHQHLYRHPSITFKLQKAQTVVRDLYAHFCAHTDELPAAWRPGSPAASAAIRQRAAGDYVAGMTDRHALQTYARLFDAPVELV